MSVGASFDNELRHRDFGEALVRVSAENVLLLTRERDALRRQLICLVCERDALRVALRDSQLRVEQLRTRSELQELAQKCIVTKPLGMSGYWI